MANLADIPDEVLGHHVFPHLRPSDRAACARVSHSFHRAVVQSWVTLDFSYVRADDWYMIIKQVPNHQLTYIKSLNLKRSHITNAALSQLLKKAPHVEYLNIKRCQRLTTFFFKELGKVAPNLRSLNMARLSEVDPFLPTKQLSQLLTTLTHLEFSISALWVAAESNVVAGPNPLASYEGIVKFLSANKNLRSIKAHVDDRVPIRPQSIWTLFLGCEKLESLVVPRLARFNKKPVSIRSLQSDFKVPALPSTLPIACRALTCLNIGNLSEESVDLLISSKLELHELRSIPLSSLAKIKGRFPELTNLGVYDHSTTTAADFVSVFTTFPNLSALLVDFRGITTLGKTDLELIKSSKLSELELYSFSMRSLSEFVKCFPNLDELHLHVLIIPPAKFYESGNIDFLFFSRTAELRINSVESENLTYSQTIAPITLRLHPAVRNMMLRNSSGWLLFRLSDRLLASLARCKRWRMAFQVDVKDILSGALTTAGVMDFLSSNITRSRHLETIKASLAMTFFEALVRPEHPLNDQFQAYSSVKMIYQAIRTQAVNKLGVPVIYRLAQTSREYTEGFFGSAPKDITDAMSLSVNARTSDGLTPLHMAVLFDNLPLCCWLIQHGAEVMAFDRGGRSLAAFYKPWEKHGTAAPGGIRAVISLLHLLVEGKQDEFSVALSAVFTPKAGASLDEYFKSH